MGCFLLVLFIAPPTRAQLRSGFVATQNNFQRINPAAINHLGIDYKLVNKSSHFTAQYQVQSVGDVEVATTFNGSYERLNFNNRVHWGINFRTQSIHFHGNHRLAVSYAYMLRLSKSELLILGGSMGAERLSSDISQIRLDEMDIPTVFPVSSSIAADFTPGVFYLNRSKKSSLYGGLSAVFSDGGNSFQSSRHYYLLAGGMFHLDEYVGSLPPILSLEASLWTRYADRGSFFNDNFRAAPLAVDGSARLWITATNDARRKTVRIFAGAGYGNRQRLRMDVGLALYRNAGGNLTNLIQAGIARESNLGGSLGFGTTLEFFVNAPLRFGDSGRSTSPVEIVRYNRPRADYF